MSEESSPLPPPPRPGGPSKWRDLQALRQGGSPTVRPRQRQALFLAGILLALVGVVVALLFWLRPVPKPQFVAFVLEEYNDAHLPPVPWARADRDALPSLGLEGKNTYTSQAKAELVGALRDFGKKMSPSTPLVIYLRAYAAVTTTGVVALLPADAKLDDESTWLPVAEVFDLLRGCPVKRRLLLLDLAQPAADARFGMLGHDVAERLLPVVQAAVRKDEELQVLCACSPGQVSLAAEEMGHSVFVYYLMQGLQGKADGFKPNTRPKGVVTVSQLAAYVKDRVDRWAWHNRQTRQTPELINAREDFILTVIDRQSEPITSPLGPDYPDELAKAWAERDGWWQDTATRTPPKLYRRLETALLRADRQWRGGVEMDKVKDNLRREQEEVRRPREALVAARREPHSLGQEVARRGGKEPDVVSRREAVNALKSLAALNALATGPKPDEKAAARLKAETEAFKKRFDNKPFELAWTVFQVAVNEEPIDQASLALWYGLLDLKDTRSRYDEVRLLEDLAGWKLAKPSDWPAATVHTALELEALMGKVPDPIDQDLSKWVGDEGATAKAKRREGLAALFAPEAAARAAAGKLLMEALQAAKEVTGRLKTLEGARKALDEALVLLPGYAAYLESEPALYKSWESAVGEAVALQASLVGSTRPPLGQVSTKESDLRRSLATLGAPLESRRLERLMEQREGGGLDDAMKMRALLRLPALKAGRRTALWSAWWKLAGRRHEEALQREATGEQLPSLDLAKGIRDAARQGLLRARVSVGLLRLSGAASTKDVEEAVRKAEQDATDPQAWQRLAKELRRTWKPLVDK
jgi:hypothetical protein